MLQHAAAVATPCNPERKERVKLYPCHLSQVLFAELLEQPDPKGCKIDRHDAEKYTTCVLIVACQDAPITASSNIAVQASW